MSEPTWRCDDYGTQILRPTVNGFPGHVWIQGRRPYCDRGHWEWGFDGLYVRPDDLPTASYYYMRHEQAIAEVEEWLARVAGATSQSRHLRDLEEATPMSHGAATKLRGTWQKIDNQSIAVEIPKDKQDYFRATITEKTTKSGPCFVFTVDNLEVDAADRFPRVYLDLDRAMAEAEEFLAWRLLKIPAETPGLLEEPDRPVGARLAKALSEDLDAMPSPRRMSKP